MSGFADDTPLDGVAIVGMAGRFPGAHNVAQFWENVTRGVESLTRFTDAELAASGLPAALRNDPNYVKARGVLDDVDQFDASFFGMSPREAAVTDPQHRVFLECAWEALEQAGYDAQTYAGAIGVYAGASLNTYLLANLCADRAFIEEIVRSHQVGNYQTLVGNDKDYLATRVSYKLNLRGPSLSVQTACSTSLVAVCQACQSLQNYQCDMALAGGVSISFPQQRGSLSQEGGMISPDGHCRPFDADAQGTVFGAGAGVVVLKRLADAVADGDTIHAVIRGYALNNDGSGKASYTAPSAHGQAQAIQAALALADVGADTLGYVEAHGTATPLGDPIEVAGLTQAFRADTEKTGFCALGSAKANIGHLEAAAGVTGLIKTVLALKHRVLPPTLHFQRPNPRIDFANSPFYVSTALTPWAAGATPRRAGVSSFGVGGTNAHAVLEEAPDAPASESARPDHLLLLSAKTETALERMTANLADHLRGTPGINLADAAYTLQVGRQAFAHRRMLVCHEAGDAATALEARDPRRVFTRTGAGRSPSVVFLFPGQGAQQVGMGRELYAAEPTFRACVDECAELLLPLLGRDLRGVLYPAEADTDAARRQLMQTWLTQPALFVTEYALARLWMSWGVTPDAMLGHSVGEFVAACLAGVFTLPDALRVLAARARLMQDLPGGSMLAVRLPEAELRPLLDAPLSLAAINSPTLCVAAGPTGAVADLQRDLEARDIVCRPLHTSHAFHSAMMDPILDSFTEVVGSVPRRAPQTPYISNLSAGWVTEAEAMDPAYWAQHLRQAVRFADGLGALTEDPNRVFLEVGPGTTLNTLARQHPSRKAEQTIVSSLDTKTHSSEGTSLRHALGQVWLAGVSVDWVGVHAPEQRRRIPLPTYSFERERHWVEPPRPTEPGHEQRMTITESDTREAPPAAVAPPPSSQPPPRTERFVSEMRTILHELSGIEIARIDATATFLDLGLDSLFLTQAAQAFQNKYGVKVTFRSLLESVPTVDALAAHIDAQLPPDPEPEAAPAPGEVRLTAPTRGAKEAAVEIAGAGNSALERVIAQQLQVMTRQLEMLRSEPAPGLASTPAPMPPAPTAPRNGNGTHAAAPSPPTQAKSFGPYKPPQVTGGGDLTPRQRRHLDALIRRTVQQTPESKRLTQAHRPHLADPRAVAGFRPEWKEMVYPIVAARSAGSKLWDVDGNEFLDVTMGFGVNLFGHSPAFVTEAVAAQLQQGVEIGPQSPLAGEVARRLCAMTGMERATFCNTGSEAVMAALRAARTVTGRTKIAYFTGDYHGTFDEVLARTHTVGGEHRSRPVAPGIPAGMVQEALVLDYGTPKTLETLKAHSHELAAVLVEPVQSRRPGFQPREFLHALRRLTAEAGVCLIFDEVITGFRIHPGGAQAWFGVQADLATYGKVIGGGMPFGVLTGKAAYMDAFDGGAWDYGDASRPEAGVTFFAGTFVRHPLALAAARAVLTHLETEGPALQERLNARTDRFAARLNAHFAGTEAPVRIVNCGSLFYFQFAPEWKWASLLFFHLRARGIHVWEGRPCFLSTAHTDEDIERLVQAFRESLAALRDGGFLPGPPPEDAPPADAPTQAPLTEAQRGVWLTSQMGADSSRAFNESVLVHLHGPLEVAALHQAVQRAVARHDALRTTLPASGEFQQVAAHRDLEVPVTDLSALPPSERAVRLSEICEEEVGQAFDLEHGPLLRVRLVRQGTENHALLLTAHHVVCDGWSFGVLLSDLGALYSAFCQGTLPSLGPAGSFHRYAERQSDEESKDEAYWLSRLGESTPRLRLPTDYPRPPAGDCRGARVSRIVSPELLGCLKRLGARQGCTLFGTLLTAYALLLHRLTGQDGVPIWVPAAGQTREETPNLVGHCVTLLPLCLPVFGTRALADSLAATRGAVLDAYDHQQFSLSRLVPQIPAGHAAGQAPLIATTFNVDRFPEDLGFHELTTELAHLPRRFFQFDLGFNIIERAQNLEVECDYRTSLFSEQTVTRWVDHFVTLLEAMAGDPEASVADLLATMPAEAPSAAVPGPQSPTITPAPDTGDAVETQLAGLWREVLNVPHVGLHDSFFELGGSSLLALHLYGRIEKAFGVRLPLPTLFQAPTVRALAAVLRREQPSRAQSAILVAIKPGGSKPPLFCVHPDHGLVLFYQALAERLAPDQPVYGLQAAGLDGAEPADTRLEDMAARYVREIRAIQPDGPYRLGGYSLGGVVAFEMARQLHAQGQEVGLLALFDTYAPVAYQKNLIDKTPLRRLTGHARVLRGKDAREKLHYLRDRVAEAAQGKKPDWQVAAEDLEASLDPARLTFLRQTIQANESAFFAYQTPSYPGRATLFRATERSVFENDEPRLWWGDTFGGGLEIRDVPGAHLTIMQEPHVRALAEALQESLDGVPTHV